MDERTELDCRPLRRPGSRRYAVRRTVEPFSLALFGCLLVVFVGLVVPPIFSLGKIALTDSDTGALTFDNFADILPRLLRPTCSGTRWSSR